MEPIFIGIDKEREHRIIEILREYLERYRNTDGGNGDDDGPGTVIRVLPKDIYRIDLTAPEGETDE